MSDESPAPVVAEVRRAPIEDALSSPMAAGLLLKLREECEAQHARAEMAEANIARLTAERDSLRFERDGVEQNRRRDNAYLIARADEAKSVIARHEAYILELEKSETDLADLRTRLRGLEQQWQPIESAPKDGTNVLLFDGETVSYGGWVSAADQGAGPDEEYLVSAGWWSVDLSDNQPTHWMPLPKSPDELARLLTTPEEPGT